MAKIIPNKGMPKLGTPEFKKWLRDFHAEHNTPEKMRARGEAAAHHETIRITDAGLQALAEETLN